MKRIIVTLTLMIASTMSLKAQYDTNSLKTFFMGFQFSRYATEWSHMFRSDLLFPVSEKWRVGGGLVVGFNDFQNERQDEGVPYEKLEARRGDIRLDACAQYFLKESNCSKHSLMLHVYFGLSGIEITAEDERAEHIVSSESGEHTSYSYNITPNDRENWGPRFQITPQISYVIDYESMHFEFGVGYDLINCIRKEYRDSPTRLSSDWNDFNTYYPPMTVNPFRDWGCGQRISGLNGFFISFFIGINIV